ncbi:XRE family transcriptional regulator [Pseudonocardiaceae bacterium YIM PH 21723]|nr:XRE family transcriptional regulator [Pseudonocardiaceae bacterium YIM PH 21723]
MARVTAAGISLALDLVQLRTAAGLEPRQLAERASLSVQAIWKIFNIEVTPKPSTVRLLAMICDADPETVERLAARALRISKQRGDLPYIASAPAEHADYLRVESEAQFIRAYEDGVVHGLLQTPAYQLALINGGLEPPEHSVAERLVELRTQRQNAMLDSGTPIIAVVNQGALERQVGGPEVMHEVLTRMLELSEQIELRVLGNEAGAHAATNLSLQLLNFAREPASPKASAGQFQVAFVEGPSGDELVVKPVETSRYARIFEQVYGLSLNRSESRQRIDTVRGRLSS